MSENLAIFLLGVVVYLIVMAGVLMLYLPAYQHEAAREGVELPALVRWGLRVLGADAATKPSTDAGREP